jgi:uncharacterized membrane-anchored protein YitT (DUF2179 family)
VTETPKHTAVDDAQGLIYGASMAAFGVVILSHLGLVTGQTAGLALLMSYVTGWGFGPVFFALNLPFYWLGYQRLGAAFVVKTFVAVAMVSALSMILPPFIRFETLNPAIGAVLFGFATGSALLALFRHGASLGGIGIVALWLQDKTGFRAGYMQMLVDGAIFTAALLLLPLPQVAYSALGALVVNMVIALNHSRDRYIAR